MSHCNNIRIFSVMVYNHLSKVFNYRLSFSEIGLTDHLVLNLAEYSDLYSDNSIEIYKMSWNVESIYGNDIDLFIQNIDGSYNWYALQAKVMSFNGAFKDLKYNSREAFQQWDKLLLHEERFGSKTFYLLYTGKPLRSVVADPIRTDCLGTPNIEELGLGIVETSVIADIRTNRITHYQQFKFEYVFPDYVDSIRKLFCCYSDLSPNTKTFEKKDIETYGYTRIYFDDTKIQSEDNDYKSDELPVGAAQIRIIISNK